MNNTTSMTKENALKILELNPQELTNETIEKKYRQMALKHHPDKTKQENAAEKFQQIHEAWFQTYDVENILINAVP